MGVHHSTVKSFKYAFQGLKTAYQSEPNLKIHVFFAISALIMAFFLRVSTLEWLLLAFTIFYVISFELLNTVLESLVDLVSPEMSPIAKIAKDVSAACVLLGAFMSVIVGIVIFLPKLLSLI
jgi:Diacylglycerol kinase